MDNGQDTCVAVNGSGGGNWISYDGYMMGENGVCFDSPTVRQYR